MSDSPSQSRCGSWRRALERDWALTLVLAMLFVPGLVVQQAYYHRTTVQHDAQEKAGTLPPLTDEEAKLIGPGRLCPDRLTFELTRWDEAHYRKLVETLNADVSWDTWVMCKGHVIAVGPGYSWPLAIWARVVGGSMGSLQLTSTLCGIAALYFFLKILRVLAVPHRVVGGLLFILMPHFYILSLLVMSDVPSLAVSLAGVYFYLRGLKENRTWPLVVAAAFTTWALHVRPYAVFIPAGVLGTALFVKEGRLRAVVFAVLPLLLRAPLMVCWGGLSSPTTQNLHQAGWVPDAFNAVLVFIGVYFAPTIVGLVKDRRRWALLAIPLAAFLFMFWPDFREMGDAYHPRFFGIVRRGFLMLDASDGWHLGRAATLVCWVLGASTACAAAKLLFSRDTARVALVLMGWAAVCMFAFASRFVFERYVVAFVSLFIPIALSVAPYPRLWLGWCLALAGLDVYHFCRVVLKASYSGGYS